MLYHAVFWVGFCTEQMRLINEQIGLVLESSDPSGQEDRAPRRGLWRLNVPQTHRQGTLGWVRTWLSVHEFSRWHKLCQQSSVCGPDSSD